MVLGFSGPPFFNLVAKKFGKVPAIITACTVGIASFAGTWFLYTPSCPILQVMASGMIAFSCAGIWMLHSAIGADIIDFDELNTGTRREGGFASFMSWILKFGNSIGMLMGGVILSLSGFDANKVAQSAQTIFWIRFMLAAIPVIGLMAAIGFAMTFPLTKKRILEIRQELEARRGTV
jgi:GPH family glycoside/pentoside/hexuronide:cation symporter